MSEILYESKHTVIKAVGDRHVQKITDNKNEALICDELLRDIEFEYVADYYGPHIEKDGKYYLLKERIEESLEVQENIVSLYNIWEKYAQSAYPLFDHIEMFLVNTRAYGYADQHATKSIYVELNKQLTPVMNQLVELVNELKRYSLYNVDWHQYNFGKKNGHIAMFELGGIKLLKESL